MSLFIPFKPHHTTSVTFQGKKNPPLSRQTSQDSVHSAQPDPGTKNSDYQPAVAENDSFRLAKRSHTHEDLNAITLPGKGGHHAMADLDAWLNRGENDDLLELIADSQHSEDHKNGDKPTAQKPGDFPSKSNDGRAPRNLHPITLLMGEDGGSTLGSFLLHNPSPASPRDRLKPQPKEGSQENPINLDDPYRSAMEEVAAKRKRVKRTYSMYQH